MADGVRRHLGAGRDAFQLRSASSPGRSCLSRKPFLLLRAVRKSSLVSSVLLGSLAGPFGGGVLADRLGRRKLLISTASVFGLGAVGAALAPDTVWLIVARIIAGIVIGVASFVALLYISEIAPVEIRGKLVSIKSSRSKQRHCHLLSRRLRVCRVRDVALDVCDNGYPGGRIWNWTDFNSRQLAMAGRLRAFGSSPGCAEAGSTPGKS